MKNIKYKIIFLVFLLITGCSVKQPQIGQKVFPQEDDYIMKALVDEQSGDYKQASNIYKFLYNKTDKTVYFRKYLSMLYDLGKYSDVIKNANKFLKNRWDDEVFKIKIFALLQQKKLKQAENDLLTKFNKKSEFFYTMMAFILTKEHKYKEALEYAKSGYALNPSKKNLLNLSDVLVKNKRYNEAIAYLQTYLNEKGCDYDVCLSLAHIYEEVYDIPNLANIYEKLGRFDRKYYILSLNYYIDEGDYKKAIQIVKKHNLSPEYLMYIYEETKDYKKAALVALNLYLKTKNIKYLLKYTIFIYKSSPDKKTAKEVIKKLEYIKKYIKSPFVYNFLGYLLIDKNINLKKGLQYVQKAINLNPSNTDYIDSLAWGYYKLHRCKMAWDIIKTINSEDKTVLLHKKMIKRCLNDFRKNNKKDKRRFRKKKK